MKLFLSGRKWIRSNKLMSKKGYCEANCVLEAKDATCHFQKQPRPPLRLIANQGNISNSKSVSTANLTRGFELHATFLTSLRLHHGAVALNQPMKGYTRAHGIRKATSQMCILHRNHSLTMRA